MTTSAEQPRQNRGQPDGGRFISAGHSESGVELSTPTSGFSVKRTLPKFELTPHSRPADWLLYRRDRFRTDPSYQRGSVWGLTRRQNLMKSMLMGMPIGAFVINHREPHDADWFVVDGKQRIETLWAFAHGEFGIPAEWVEERFQGNLSDIEYNGQVTPGVTLSAIHPFTHSPIHPLP